MKNILVATDFSAASRNAAKYAAALAQPFNAKLILINVVVPPIIVDDSLMAPVMVTQAELMEENRKRMNKEIDHLSKKHSIKINGFVQEGFALDKIQKMANLKHAGLIVIGMKGKGKSKSVFGSTTTTVIRESAFPILVIPEKAVFEPIERIIFASDFDTTIKLSRYSALLKIATKFNSVIDIVNVQKKGSALKPEKAIGKMKASLAFSRNEHEFHTIKENKVEDGINKFIEMSNPDILAMVSHKHSLFKRMFGKVHTKVMSYQTKIPLLVLQNK